MANNYGYFKATEGTKRLKNTMDFLGDLSRGIGLIQIYGDKKSRYLEPEDRMKLASYALGCDEIYWKQFHKFIDQVKHFREE